MLSMERWPAEATVGSSTVQAYRMHIYCELDIRNR